MVTFPPCKINLGLQVLAKEPDGYHSIATCFYPLPFEDALEILPASELKFTQSGIAIPGKAENNICLKAYHLLAADHKIPPVHIHLHKVIPTGAGLGGGSADGAYTLRLLNEIFSLNLPNDRLEAYSRRLGSDCAFFLQGLPMIGTGRGDKLEPVSVSLKGKYLRLYKPDIHISTAVAYSGVVPKKSRESIAEILTMPIPQWRERLKNDFEESVFAEYPVVEQIKHELYASGAIYASMSGSGSAVFGIFDKDKPVEFLINECWSGWL
jgi:4-diphosphocytidyl-2-C-methyl-D-erythritol kinase